MVELEDKWRMALLSSTDQRPESSKSRERQNDGQHHHARHYVTLEPRFNICILGKCC